jgi:PAS domain S-box-containing protein
MVPEHPVDPSSQVVKVIAPLESILSSIGDGIIATDEHGHITFINPVAEKLTGWSAEEAQGESLQNVFRIVNEDTRQEVDNPALRAISEGIVFGLANHTVLLTKDGNEIPIDDSGSPIKDATGAVIGAVLIFRDITQRRKADKTRGLLAAIIESSEDAIVSKSLDGIIDSWNKSAEQLFEYAAEEAIGQPITIIVPPDRLHEEEEILRRLQRGERIEHLETVRVSKSGRPIDVEVTISPVRNNVGQVIGASKIARDISPRKIAEAARIEVMEREAAARKLAEQASRAKDEFIAQLSHELRTPLHSILGWTTMLRVGQVPAAEAPRALDTIERNTRVQIQLIDELLDVSRGIKGQITLNVRPIEIGEVIEAALDSIRPAVAAKSIELRTQIKDEHSVVEADPDRLQQILWNLLSNAVKFTPRDGTIDFSVGRLDHHLEIVVSDSGIGIDPEFLPLVFDRFSQANTGRTSGLGLGLAIVRHLVELHGGAVRAESKGEGTGATFHVVLPIKP